MFCSIETAQQACVKRENIFQQITQIKSQSQQPELQSYFEKYDSLKTNDQLKQLEKCEIIAKNQCDSRLNDEKNPCRSERIQADHHRWAMLARNTCTNPTQCEKLLKCAIHVPHSSTKYQALDSQGKPIGLDCSEYSTFIDNIHTAQDAYSACLRSSKS